MQAVYELLVNHKLYFPPELVIEPIYCSLSSDFTIYLPEFPYRIRVGHNNNKTSLSVIRIDDGEINEQFTEYRHLGGKILNSNEDLFVEICCLCVQIKSLSRLQIAEIA